MEYVLGIDLGTSSVKIVLYDNFGNLVNETKVEYSILSLKEGYSEQLPEDWYNATIIGVKKILKDSTKIDNEKIKGISFSGQMHGLVLVDKEKNVIRPAILWNDTRTTIEKDYINKQMGDKIYHITGHTPLEGFTLPKLLWVKYNEPEKFKKIYKFLLPKDFLRFRITGDLKQELSDASGTAMLDINRQKWSEKIIDEFNFPRNIFPELINSNQNCGTISQSFSNSTGLSKKTLVYAGGSDNACGALAAGLENDMIVTSIGTSGVVIKKEVKHDSNHRDYRQVENFLEEQEYYSMTVNLTSGKGLDWFNSVFTQFSDVNELIKSAENSSVGSNGLLFAPYLMGERFPYDDSNIRGSFLGISSQHTIEDFTRSVLEGILFSLKDISSIHDFSKVNYIVATGGGASNDFWMQMQANILGKDVYSSPYSNPATGAAIIAAFGLNWINTMKVVNIKSNKNIKKFSPDKSVYSKYESIFKIYKKIYKNTVDLTHELLQLTR